MHQQLTASPELALELARLHWSLTVGDRVNLVVRTGPDAAFAAADIADLLIGAGFAVIREGGAPGGAAWVVRRLRSLPDTVAPRMRLLVCGLNPSEFAADSGLPFARPTNRFWRAAVAARIAPAMFDPVRALEEHGTGMTDLVKRATPRSADLTAQEYREGLARVERLLARQGANAVCFVGLEGWRAAVDRRAASGPQSRDLAGVRVYVMPSTSGLNAHARLDDLVNHLRAARRLGTTSTAGD